MTKLALKRFKSLFENSNYTPKQDIQLSRITQKQFESVVKKNNIEVSYCTIQGIVTLYKDGNLMSIEEIKAL